MKQGFYRKLSDVALAVVDLIPFERGHREQGYMITRVNVPVGHRGEGVARELMAELLAAADAEGCYLWAIPQAYEGSPMGNSALAAWYGRLGFTPDGGPMRRVPAHLEGTKLARQAA